MWEYEEVQIGDKKVSEWNLMLQTITLPQPAAKTNYLDIPGNNGGIDFTEAFGAVFYKNREKVQMVFDYAGNYAEFQKTVSEVANEIHGKRKKIILGYDTDFYYMGRLEIDPKKTNEALGTITMKGTFDPFKYKANKTIKSYIVSASTVVILENLYQPVVPELTVTGEITILFQGDSFTVNEGTKQLPELVLEAGENHLTLSGSGTIRFEYQEAGL